MPEEKKMPAEKQGKAKIKAGVPERKIKAVEELVKLLEESRSIIIVSIKNLPAKQFQLIKKKLRGEAVIKVVKKNIIGRAIDDIEKGAIKNLKKFLREDIALIFSKLDPFELSSILSKNKSMARAKVGQKVEEDVVVGAGPTELVPGPIISELGNLGIKFTIEDGKINIKEGKVVVKQGEGVGEEAASILGKLDMKPISVGLEPVIAYDTKEDKIYEEIKIDQDKTLAELKEAVSRALGVAVKIVYYCKDSIGFLLRRASAEGRVLEKFIKDKPLEKVSKAEEKAEKGKKAEVAKAEEKKEASEEKKESTKNNAQLKNKQSQEGK